MAPSKPLKLSIIPFATVQAALDSSTAFNPQRKFNTHEHRLEEIAAALPDASHRTPDSTQPWLLLNPWLELILESQSIPPSSVHKIKLPGWLCDMLVDGGRSWQLTRRVPTESLADLDESFQRRTIDGVKLTDLLPGSERFFVRLDTCSLKDAETLPSPADTMGGKPIGNREDLGSEGVEFRVFCPTPGRIAANSQYVWHQRLRVAGQASEGGDLARWCMMVFDGIKEIHESLGRSAEFNKDMERAGFTFDVLVMADGIQLVELNTFGATTGCGSCLFHWVQDARMLYGLEDEIEFRVAL